MPAKSLQRVSGESTYSLVYNKGVENRTIFNDTQDYDVFIKYLKEYLSAPLDLENTKQIFTINGRTYKGTPHLPKNYLNEVELIAYRLLPDYFYLILHQVTPSSQTRFLRSLLTRYSIYFNKKYKHTGPLFDGPYKSTPINSSKLAEAAEEIHSLKTNHNQAEIYSSYYEYEGKRVTSWLKPAKVLAPERLNIEHPKKYPAHKSIPVSSKPNNPKHLSFFASSFTIFVLLFAIGLMNVNISSITAKAPTVAVLVPTSSPSLTPLTPVASPVATPIPEVAAAEDENPLPKTEIVINIGKDLKSVNLREKATTSSIIVGTAVNGETFEFVSETPGWYKIMLEDGSAYVSTKYAQKKGEVTN